MAGIQYIGSETWSKKSDAKDLIVRSIGALVLMFSAFIFFEQLNPELLKVRFKPVNVSSKKPIIFNGVIDNAFTDFADFNTDSKSTILEKDG